MGMYLTRATVEGYTQERLSVYFISHHLAAMILQAVLFAGPPARDVSLSKVCSLTLLCITTPRAGVQRRAYKVSQGGSAGLQGDHGVSAGCRGAVDRPLADVVEAS